MMAGAHLAAQHAADELFDALDGVLLVEVATVDGFHLASAGHADLDGRRIAAMSSALAALGTELTREAGLGECHAVVLSAPTGHVVSQYLGSPQDAGMVVTVLAGQRATLGMILVKLADQGQQLLAPVPAPDTGQSRQRR